MALPSRRAAKRRTEERRGPGRGLRPGVVFSALLHLSLAALVIVASLQREKPPEPLPPPSYAMEFERGAPDRPAEEESNPPPSVAEAPQQDAVPQEAPAPEAPLAEVEPPAPEPAWTPREAQTRPPPQPEAPLTAEATPPRPEDLPIPPPPAPPQPQRDAALTSPPRPPARPPPSERLPGLFLPEARTLQPAPPRPAGSRPGLDLSPGRLQQPGRDSPDAQALVRGAQVGPDWRNAFRRWLEDHKRYPEAARVVGEEGTNRIELIVDPDGRVRSARLLRRSGSVWLDAGTMSLFRNAVLPPFPPGSDPSGVTVDLTINYILIR